MKTSERERSGDPESRGPALELLSIFKEARAMGENGSLSYGDLQEIGRIIELRKTDPTRAAKLSEQRKERRARELDEYFEKLRSRIKKI